MQDSQLQEPAANPVQSEASEATVHSAVLEDQAKEFANALVRTYMERSIRNWEHGDRASTWMLGGAATTIALIVGNLSALRIEIGQLSIHITVWALAASVFAGLAQKYFAISVGLAVAFSEAREEALDEHAKIAEHIGTSAGSLTPQQIAERVLLPFVNVIMKEMKSAVPRPFHFLFRGALRKALTSQDDSRIRSYRAMVWQNVLVFVQLGFLAVAVVVATIAV